MKLLLSKKKALYVRQNNFLDAFEEYASSADFIHISTGFISIESLQYLHDNVKGGVLPALDLTIGMHHFDGFTKTQYDSALDFAKYLTASKNGSVNICTSFPYHGKMYVFYKKGVPFAAIVGSSNLSGLEKRESINFEVDMALEDPVILNELFEFQNQLKEKATEPLELWRPKAFIENFIVPDAEELSGKETADYWRLERMQEFLIPLKAEPKSNLNACFGKGRENKRKKFIRKRPWHEVELIVPKIITTQEGYPYHSSFRVVTDDGWSFLCNTNGTNSKNFRSQNGLCTLGAWIKGRLESSGLLKIGEQVTEAVLKKYGKDHLKLIKTVNPGIWLLDFSKRN